MTLNINTVNAVIVINNGIMKTKPWANKLSNLYLIYEPIYLKDLMNLFERHGAPFVDVICIAWFWNKLDEKKAVSAIPTELYDAISNVGNERIY